MRPLRGVVFDLDDTLYAERDYVASGFRKVAEEVGSHTGLPVSELWTCLWDAFEAGHRGDLFNRLQNRFPSTAASHEISEMVKIYRQHTPEIELSPEVEGLLGQLRDRGVPLALISDGYLEAQQQKVNRLQLDRFFDPLILTDSLGRECWKPHERAFRLVQEAWGLNGEGLIYVGDNPVKDFVAPRRLGWYGLRLRREGQESYLRPVTQGGEPHHEVASFSEVAEHLWAGLAKGAFS